MKSIIESLTKTVKQLECKVHQTPPTIQWNTHNPNYNSNSRRGNFQNNRGRAFNSSHYKGPSRGNTQDFSPQD